MKQAIEPTAVAFCQVGSAKARLCYSDTMEQKLPLPPFTLATATEKVRLAENAWNSCDPDKVAGAYSIDSFWRNRSEIFQGRESIRKFLQIKWKNEREYRLVKELWAFSDSRIAVRFQYEWHDETGRWHRSYGNENWEFDGQGLMQRREASINDIVISEAERRWLWSRPGPRPQDHPGLLNSPE